MAFPAVWAIGVSFLPVIVPGAAVSPGMRICNLASEPERTLMDGLVLEVLLPFVTLLAVSVLLPAVLRVNVKLRVPPTMVAFVGNAALASLEVSPTVSAAVTGFQFASPALTVTKKVVSENWMWGEPLFPVGV